MVGVNASDNRNDRCKNRIVAHEAGESPLSVMVQGGDKVHGKLHKCAFM